MSIVGLKLKRKNAATYLNGLDKSFKTHIQEFQKRNIPVAVYAYVAAMIKRNGKRSRGIFTRLLLLTKPTYYWLDVEEKP